MASELKHCPFCSKTMMLRSALWPSEGDADAIIHADPTDCPMLGFSDGSADGSIIEKWNCSLSNEDDFPSDGSCVRCGSVPRNANGLCNTCLDEDAERLENTRPTPVAPVSPDATGKCGELVTVAWFQPSQRCCDNGWMEAMAWQEGEFSAPVVLRSQAVELLASEIRRERDLAEKQLSEVVDRMSDDYLALKADNAAKDAELKAAKEYGDKWFKYYSDLREPFELNEIERRKLEADNAALTARVNVQDQEISDQSDMIADQLKMIEALEAKLAAAEKALEPFVSFFNEAMKGFTEGYAERTPSDKPVLGWNNAYLLMQHFIEARAALGGKLS